MIPRSSGDPIAPEGHTPDDHTPEGHVPDGYVPDPRCRQQAVVLDPHRSSTGSSTTRSHTA